MTATTPAKPPTLPLPAPPESAEAAFLHRMPKVRQSLTIILPEPTADRPQKAAYICVTEQRDSVQVRVREAGSGLDHDVRLNLPEARTLAEHLNKICERIRKRPAYRP